MNLFPDKVQKLMLPKEQLEDNLALLNNTDELVSGSTKSDLILNKLNNICNNLNNHNNSVFKTLHFNELNKQDANENQLAIYKHNNYSNIENNSSLNSNNSKIELINNLQPLDELEIPIPILRPIYNEIDNQSNQNNIAINNSNNHIDNNMNIIYNNLNNGIRIYKEYDEILGKTIIYKTRIIESTEKLKLQDIKNNINNVNNNVNNSNNLLNIINNYHWDNINKYNVKQAVKLIKTAKDPKVYKYKLF
jgi:hypothetical protein